MKRILLALLILSAATAVNGQKKWEKLGYKISPPVCYASDEVVNSYIPPDPELLKQLKSSEKKSNIIVTYSLFPPEAKEAFEYAINIWEHIIESPVPIYMRANWRTLDRNVLGSCGPSDYLTNFESIPHKDRYYPVAIAEKISKKQISGFDNPDMTATFNKTVDWYFGTDGNVPDSLYDFATVVLHEVAHGLGFTGFFFVNENLGTYGYYDIGEAAAFDLLVQRNTGDFLVDELIYKNPSEELRKALESGLLYAFSPVAMLNNKGVIPRLYSPLKWDEGSSVYHLNDATYPGGTPNSLMTHAFGFGEAIHQPGPITQGIMADIGWQHLYIDFEELKDQEEVSPLVFEVSIESDFALDTSSLYVYYSLDSFQNHVDSIPLLAVDEKNLFAAEYTPAENVTELFYYISASDEKARVYNRPTEAPDIFFSVKFGPDSEKPVIIHTPIEYYFMADDEPKLTARVSDNIGVDTVYVEYSINDNPQEPFPMIYDTLSIYNGYFNLDGKTVNDGDIIKYNIVAKDISSAENTARMPLRGTYSFRIEEELEALREYKNDFETAVSDFILSDFDVYRATGFENNALHSPHPYPSPEIDDSILNFTTILKHPIILQNGGKMVFDEIVLVEPGSPGTLFGDDNFWDYVIVEATKNGGLDWYPLANGYDARANPVWEDNYSRNVTDQVSEAIGIPEWYVSREINLLENEQFAAGDTILIRFRLFSDPYAHGWGWAIDNLRIQNPTPVQQPVLSPGNISVYPNPFDKKLHVEISPKEMVSNIQIDVFNLYGQKIKTLQYNKETGRIISEINLNDVSNGMYLITVSENGAQIFAKKVIKR